MLSSGAVPAANSASAAGSGRAPLPIPGDAPAIFKGASWVGFSSEVACALLRAEAAESCSLGYAAGIGVLGADALDPEPWERAG